MAPSRRRGSASGAGQCGRNRAHPKDVPDRFSRLRRGPDGSDLAEAVKDAWRLKPEVQLYPGMPAAERRVAVKAAGDVKHVRARAGVLAHLRDFIGMDGAKAGRVFLASQDTDHGSIIVVRTHSIDAIAKNFQVPTSGHRRHATGRGGVQGVSPSGRVPAPHHRADAPRRDRAGARRTDQQGQAEGQQEPRAVRRAIFAEWIRLERKAVLVVAQKPYANWLRTDGKLPDSISVEHYGAIAGSTSTGAFAASFASAASRPIPGKLRQAVGAVTGLYPETVAVPRGEGKGQIPWYNKVLRGIRMSDGSGRAVTVDEHPDPLCEAIRRGICEDQIIQAIGRGRGVWRTAETPLDVTILADVCLDLTVDAVKSWEASGEEVEMLVQGVVLTSPTDMAAAWSDVWATPKAAERWVEKRRPQNTSPVPYIEDILLRFGGSVHRFRYQREGRNQKWRTGFHDPAVVPDPLAWLESRLGPSAGFHIEGTAQPSASPVAYDYARTLVARREPDAVRLPLFRAEVIRFDPAAPITFPPLIAGRLGLMRAAESVRRVVAFEAAE